MSKLTFYNTLGREYQEFLPINDNQVGIYTCGPTVYNYAHIGNLKAYVFADILRRSIEYFGYKTKHVMNITDVGHLTDDADSGEDKMELQASKKGKSAWELADYYTKKFFENCDKLNIKKPHIICKATDHIQEQIELIEKLEGRGYTYTNDDGVYFDSSLTPTYGELAKLKIEGLREGERVSFDGKKNKTDFALWKFSRDKKKRQMEWNSPWGIGFPGWHIECSAMAMKYLGESFDIHTGGIDHIPVHHTNEIAQSEAASGKRPFVNYWLHNEFLTLDRNEKMSKSEDNFLTLDKLEEDGFDPIEYRYFLINSHYRSKLKFSKKILASSTNGLNKLRKIIERVKRNGEANTLGSKALEFKQNFEKHLAYDLDLPNLMANFWNMLNNKSLSDEEKYSLFKTHDIILGLGIESISESKVIVPEEIMKLVNQREEARKNKDWELADKLRSEIEGKNYTLSDAADGILVSRKRK